MLCVTVFHVNYQHTHFLALAYWISLAIRYCRIEANTVYVFSFYNFSPKVVYQFHGFTMWTLHEIGHLWFLEAQPHPVGD